MLFLSQFEESMIVYDACRLIRERVPDAASGQRKLREGERERERERE